MAYGERENARLLLDIVRNSTTFSGRSRRTEVIYYVIALSLIGTVVGFAAHVILRWTTGMLVTDFVQASLAIPMFALFARRLHDQGKSGWWALLLVAAVVLSIPDRLRWINGDPTQLLDYEQSGPHLLRYTSAFIGLAVLLLYLWPGTIGANRFGPDPRESEL